MPVRVRRVERMKTRHGIGPLLGLLAVEAAAFIALLRLGRVASLAMPVADLGGWLVLAPPADAVVAVLRLVALTASGWLLASTLVYTATGMLRRRSALLGRLTLPLVRRVADRAVALVLVTSGMGGTALAATELVPPGAHSVTGEPAPAPAPAPGGDVATSTQGWQRAWVVAEGQHLWGIARALLEEERPSEAPTDREVHARWIALLEANADGFVSGDPDLIHPGEVLDVPGCG